MTATTLPASIWGGITGDEADRWLGRSGREALQSRPVNDIPSAAAVSADPVPAGDLEHVRAEEAALDDLLVQRVRRGERSAYDLLVRRYQHRIYAAVARLVRDRSECEDITQEVFLRAYRALASFRGDSSFYTWLYKIAINTAKNHLASAQRRPRVADVDEEVGEALEGQARLRDRATPENEMIRREIERTVLDAVAELPEEMRRAVTLREVEGLSYEEIAALMQCPIGTVRSRIFRGREAIDRRLRPLIEE